MKYAARPIIQIEGAIDTSGHITKKRIDLPEKLAARVNLTLLPNHRRSLTKMRKQVVTYKTTCGHHILSHQEKLWWGMYPNLNRQPFQHQTKERSTMRDGKEISQAVKIDKKRLLNTGQREGIRKAAVTMTKKLQLY